MRILKTAALGGALLAASMVSAQDATVTIGVRDHVNEHVSLASEGQFVAVTWAASRAGSGTDVYAASSQDGGRSFSPPVRLSGAGSRADVGGEQAPQITLVPQPGRAPRLTVIWTSKGEGGTRLVSAQSADGGVTFGRAAVVAGSEGPGNRGWEAISTDSRGRTVALWLDHRDTARQGTGGEAHHHSSGADGKPAAGVVSPVDGATRAQSSQLYFGSLDTSLAARGIARGVCYCCRTALASGDEGAIYAAWRHVYAGNRRDIAFMVSRDGGRTFGPPVRVSADEWQLDGCPENGPAMAVDRQRRVHVVWPTLVRERGASTLALFHAVTSDGTTFTPRAALPTAGAAYHPRLAIAADGSLLAAWDEAVGGERRIRLARGTPDRTGLVTFRPMSLGVSAEARYPALTATPTHAVLAWASRQSSPAQIVVVRVPLS